MCMCVLNIYMCMYEICIGSTPIPIHKAHGMDFIEQNEWLWTIACSPLCPGIVTTEQPQLNLRKTLCRWNCIQYATGQLLFFAQHYRHLPITTSRNLQHFYKYFKFHLSCWILNAFTKIKNCKVTKKYTDKKKKPFSSHLCPQQPTPCQQPGYLYWIISHCYTISLCIAVPPIFLTSPQLLDI